MHNTTDVDSCQRAIRAIEIETYNLDHPTDNRDFPAIDSVIVGVGIDRVARREKITSRLRKRLDNGMVEEIRGILDKEIAIHQFAKRQMTWFRGMERRGATIHWIDAALSMEEKVKETIRLLRHARAQP